jgi:hypothetical protein
MSLENLLKNIHEGDYVSAKKDFFEEINERVSSRIEEKRLSILEGDDADEDDDKDDEKDSKDKKDSDEDDE